VTVPANGIVSISTDGGLLLKSGSSTTGFGVIEVDVLIDGTVPTDGGYRVITIGNSGGTIELGDEWHIALTRPLSAGPHTISVAVRVIVSSDAVLASGHSGGSLQGQLTVLVISP
jgi:hypothetical protein